MSGHLGYVEDEDEVLATATTLTLVQLVVAANSPIQIVAWGVGFDSQVAADEPIRCRLQIQTSAGTSSASTVQEYHQFRSDGFATTGLENFTAEPTKGIGFPTRTVPATSGFEIWYPEGREPGIAESTRVGIEVISGTLSASLDDVSGFIVFSE